MKGRTVGGARAEQHQTRLQLREFTRDEKTEQNPPERGA
jgi:hypothetical protein